MIGTLPEFRLAPLDYRCALDGARIALGSATNPIVVCNCSKLVDEVRQRFPHWIEAQPAVGVLWVEPLANIWQAELSALTGALVPGGMMAAIVSQPLARILPERQGWGDQALGMRINGLARLRRVLINSGFTVEALHGFHAIHTIGLNLLSRTAERWGHPELGDRLHFAARLRYRVGSPLTSIATVVLLVARKLDRS